MDATGFCYVALVSEGGKGLAPDKWSHEEKL